MTYTLANEGDSYDKGMENQRSLLGHDVARTPEKTPCFTSPLGEDKRIHFELRIDPAERICDE